MVSVFCQHQVCFFGGVISVSPICWQQVCCTGAAGGQHWQCGEGDGLVAAGNAGPGPAYCHDRYPHWHPVGHLRLLEGVCGIVSPLWNPSTCLHQAHKPDFPEFDMVVELLGRSTTTTGGVGLWVHSGLVTLHHCTEAHKKRCCLFCQGAAPVGLAMALGRCMWDCESSLEGLSLLIECDPASLPDTLACTFAQKHTNQGLLILPCVANDTALRCTLVRNQPTCSSSGIRLAACGS